MSRRPAGALILEARRRRAADELEARRRQANAERRLELAVSLELEPARRRRETWGFLSWLLGP